jgi:hypothetical protein
MLKNLSQLEHVVENRVCRFVCDNDAPIHVIKECLFQFQRYIGQVEDYAKAQVEQQKSQNKVEPISEVNDVKS